MTETTNSFGRMAAKADLLRASYQNQAALLLFPTDPLLSRVFSYKAAESASSLAGSVAANAVDAIEVVDDTYVCRACGLFLIPGAHGTNLRVRPLGRGATRRRRDSRNKRRLATAAQLASNQQTPKTSSAIPNVLSRIQGKEDRKQGKQNEQRLRQATDGEACNAVVFTCGCCATKAKFKGIPVAVEQKQRSAAKDKEQTADKQKNHKSGKEVRKMKQMRRLSSDSGNHSFTKRKAIESHPHLAPESSRPTTPQQGIDEDEEFIPVISLPNADSRSALPVSDASIEETDRSRCRAIYEEEAKEESIQFTKSAVIEVCLEQFFIVFE